MKVDISPQAVTARLKLVGELARVCLLLRQAKKRSDAAPEHAAQTPGKAALKDG
jgi:hypothetical protein